MNKVQFGISKAYYAVLTTGEDGKPKYATPKPLPGAVSLSMDAQGNITKFPADNIVYYQSSANNGYEGDFELALIPDEFRQDVLGETLDGNKIMFENAAAEIKSFAFLVQFEGDKKATRHCYFNCTVTRPSNEAKTIEDSKEPQTEKMTLSAISNEDGNVKCKTTPNTPDAVYNAWYEAVPTFDEVVGG